ncbi:MAG: cupin domain-containing protein [Alphaproteobacteria bacterium]|nr:cupin domain-containing protein [Alphaproteobacteria bacterium]
MLKAASVLTALMVITVSEVSYANPTQVVEPTQGRQIIVPMHPTRHVVPAAATASGLSVYEIALEPRSPGTPPHIHANEDEFLYVIEGEVSVQIEDEAHQVSEGAMVIKPRGQLHAFWNGSDAPARLLLTVSGEGDFEAFFDGVETAATEMDNPEPFEARMAALAEASGITIEMGRLATEARSIYQPN